ncbi:hypothetical protein CTAYLR_004732 [Chrysophaeum taylorii]|uniref:Uncharacterized protein n=1 Tax=Chrysophaeum taylorii TaxID=2483200 RepID=A0AAD7XFT5_9STRA|nr:hypothetical protein CTAYLR_004732 [Chrysophaeum taylorii]
MDVNAGALSETETALARAEPVQQADASNHLVNEEDVLEDEDDIDTPVTFLHVEDLAAHGAHAGEISKLRKRGLTTVGLVASASMRELIEVPGLSTERADFLRKKAKLVDGKSGVVFASGLDLVRSMKTKITTGSAALDALIGGGVETKTITELYGDSATGKTQLCHALCVRTQFARDQGGAEGCALYIDTDQTFRPDRIQQIAEAVGFDPQQILGNIVVIKATSFDHQCEIATAATRVLADPPSGEFRLIIVDNLMTHLRAEYAGRGELAARQQALNSHLRWLKQLADEFDCAVVVTNQVSTVPEAFAMGGATVKPCGGPVLAHNAPMRIWLRKGRAQQKKATLEHSAFMPKGDCLFSIVAAGIVDSIEGA